MITKRILLAAVTLVAAAAVFAPSVQAADPVVRIGW